VLIAAIKQLAQEGRNVGASNGEGRKITATIVGDGPDRAIRARGGKSTRPWRAGASSAPSAGAAGVQFGAPSDRALTRGVLPYIVLEAAAAGVPMIASQVGGIPEIFGSDLGSLVAPGDPEVLARAISQAMQDRGARHSASLRLKTRLRALFSADAMTDAILAAYREALAHRPG
jgi:glycosyltransferase involved in cell wall biosynthesis